MRHTTLCSLFSCTVLCKCLNRKFVAYVTCVAGRESHKNGKVLCALAQVASEATRWRAVLKPTSSLPVFV